MLKEEQPSKCPTLTPILNMIQDNQININIYFQIVSINNS